MLSEVGETGDAYGDGVVFVVEGFCGDILDEALDHVGDGFFVAATVAGHGDFYGLWSVFVYFKIVEARKKEHDTACFGDEHGCFCVVLEEEFFDGEYGWLVSKDYLADGVACGK